MLAKLGFSLVYGHGPASPALDLPRSSIQMRIRRRFMSCSSPSRPAKGEPHVPACVPVGIRALKKGSSM